MACGMFCVSPEGLGSSERGLIPSGVSPEGLGSSERGLIPAAGVSPEGLGKSKRGLIPSTPSVARFPKGRHRSAIFEVSWPLHPKQIKSSHVKVPGPWLLPLLLLATSKGSDSSCHTQAHLPCLRVLGTSCPTQAQDNMPNMPALPCVKAWDP